MRKKSVILSLILSLILFLVGAVALGWVLNERKNEKKLLQEQQQRFDAGLDKLDRVVTGEIDAHSFANTVPSENRQQELDKYKARMERRELIFIVSVVCIFAGGVILGWWLLLWTARLITRGLSYLTEFSTNVFRWHNPQALHRKKISDKKLGKTPTGEDGKVLVRKSVRTPKENSVGEQEQKQHKHRGWLKKHSKILVNSGWYDFGTNFANRDGPAPLEKVFSMRSEPHVANLAKDAGKLAVLLSDEKSVEFEGLSKAVTENLNVDTGPSNQLSKTVQKDALPDSQENYPDLEDLLITQTENLEKQVAEFRQMTQTVQQTAISHSEPLRNGLKELIQQVSAIREYALQQQGRMEKLQDGYDWNIIRTFCLRVIRCIDNLEKRIARLARENVETIDLEEVRDELVFALESSGVEQFEPEISSDYRGQEKTTEAVKDKESCDDPTLTGKIAKVLRAGYQYIIDEGNVKVVRTARVKLFA